MVEMLDGGDGRPVGSGLSRKGQGGPGMISPEIVSQGIRRSELRRGHVKLEFQGAHLESQAWRQAHSVNDVEL